MKRYFRTSSRWAFALLTATLATAAGATARAEGGVLAGPSVNTDIRFAVPKVVEGKLANGIRVLFVSRHDIPLFTAYVSSTIAAGDAAPGVASLAAQSAVASAHHSHWMRDYKPFNLIGARLWSDSDYRMTSVGTRAMVPNLELALAELSEVAYATFPDGDIIREARDQATDALERAERDSATYAARELAYPATHPYHFAPAGTVQAIRGVGTSEARAFWRRAFTASNVTITVSGDVDFERLMKALETSFGQMPRGDASTPSTPMASPVAAQPGVVLIDRPGTTQARVAVVAQGVPVKHPDHAAFSLAADAIDSTLFARVRDVHGTSYGLHTFAEAERGTAPFWTYGSVENGAVGQEIDEIRKAIGELRDTPLSKDRLDHYRVMAFQETARSFETSSETATLLAHYTALGLSLSDISDIPKHLEAVTAEAVQRVAKEHLDPKQLHVVVVGDAKILKPDLEAHGLGPIEVRSPKQ